MKTNITDGETTLVLDNGVRIVSHGDEEFMAGADVHVIASDGSELGYWSCEEWEADPRLVMGAIMRCAAEVRLRWHL
jgi:hypothetical protein